MIARLIKYRKITLMFFILAVLMGVFSFATLKQRENPEIPITVAKITTVYPGASPEKVEQLVTKPLEDKIKEMDEISEIESVSASNVSNMIIYLKSGVDIERSWQILRQKVQSAESELPDGAHKPEVNDDIAKIAEQIFHLVVETPEEKEGLRPLLEAWKEQLRTVPGVSSVEIVGLPEQEVKVQLDLEKLAGYRLPWTVAVAALQNVDQRVPLGMVEQGNREFLLNLTGEWKTVQDIADTVIYRTPEGAPVRLKDVAEVKIAAKENVESVAYNSKPAVDLVINAEKGVDIPSLQDRIDERMEILREDLPAGVTLQSVFTQKESVEHLFDELGRELLIGMVAVVIVCSLGLTLSTALMVALAIPISIAVGFIPLDVLGIDLNQITIISLVIVLGILVDDAIVVNDNIERRLQLGESPEEAAVEGSREVSISILTATVATAAAFFPLFFLKGDIGNFIRPIPVVISLTLLASMIMSLTIIPIFRKWAEERRRSRGTATIEFKSPGLLGKPLHRLTLYYEKQIYRFLRRPLLTGTIALLVGTSSLGLLPLLGVQYFPNAEREEFMVDINLPSGYTLEMTEQVMEEAAEWAKNQPGVKEVSAYTGRTAPKFFLVEQERMGNNTGQLFVKVDRGIAKTGSLITPWREELERMFPEANVIPRELEQGPPVGAPIAVRISGPDLQELREISQSIKDYLHEIPGAVNISDDMGLNMYTVDLELDKEKASLLGVSERDLSMTVRMATEGLKAGSLEHGDDLLDVVLYSGFDSPNAKDAAGVAVGDAADGTIGQQKLDQISRLMIPTQSGTLTPLSELVQMKPGWMTKVIHHHDYVRTVTVRGYTDGRLPSEVITELKEKLTGLDLAAGYQYEIAGENKERDEAFAAIGKLSLIVLLLINIIIAMQFYSFSIPLLILSTIYLAGGGALIGLFLTGAPIGFMALMGMVSLSGIVVRNGIVLVEFIEQARHRGLELYDAVAQAGKARLRPILLTMATAVGGLSPMAILGGNLWRPMAMAIIAGLIFSTVLTLIVVPSLYVRLALWRDGRKEKRERRLAQISSVDAGETGMGV